MRPELYVAAREALTERLTREIHRDAADALAARARFALAIPGGSVVAALKTVALDWRRSHVFWVDERAVPATSPDSNFGLAKSLWLDAAGASPPALHRMPADDPDLDCAAKVYSDDLRQVLGEMPRLDLALLGVGPDGHVASLFAGHSVLAEHQLLVAPVFDAPKPPPRRLTLTMPMLASARRVIVMAVGASKAGAMAKALRDDASSLPVALVLRQSPRSLVLLDDEAASLL